MVWPFGASSTPQPSPSENSKKREERAKHEANGSTSWNDLLPQPSPPLQAAKEWSPVFLTAVGSLAAFMFYQKYLRRFAGAGSVQDNYFRTRTLFGKVTSVGDGDGFRLYHTPGGRLAGWGWLRKIPNTRAELKERTISVRLAGIDAPEGPHFGRPGQPFAAEALAYLSGYIKENRVRAYIWKRDQYNRVVATVYVRKFMFRKDVGLELLKQGLATTYESKSGVEWGGKEDVYRAAEAKAKAKKLGIWSGKASEFESPRAYKSKIYEADRATTEKESKEEQEKEKEQRKKSWWRSLFP